MRLHLPMLVVVLVVLALASTQTSCGHVSDEEITAQAEREAYDNKITYRLPDGRIFEAELPIEYVATVTQCNPKCVKRYYARSK